MKKVLLTIAAAVALVACTNDEVIGTYQDAIGFEGAYVENATRAAIDKTYDNDNLQEFQVYATISNTTGTANIFEGEKVVRGNSLGQGTNWSYDATNTQYWVAGNTYNFRAVADGNVENATEAVTDAKGLLTGVKLLDVNAQRDILFAEQMAVDYTAGEGAKTVKFTFRHLLSKVKFTFKNTIATDNGYGYVVTNIAINNTAKSAEYTIGGKWEKTAEVANVAFGNATSANEENAAATLIAYNGKEESNLERLLVPGTENMNITFTYTLYKDGVVIDTQDKTIDTDAITLEEGGAYNFVISLGNPGEPIHFDVEEVTEWVPAGGEQVSMVTVSTVEDFLAAVANPEVDVITLSGDLVLNDSATRATADPTVTVKKDKTLAINLGGYTLSATSTNTGKNYNMFDVNGGELTVTNGKLVYEHKGANMGWNSSTNLFNITAGGVLNLDGVTAQNLGGSDMAFVAHLNNWGEATLNVNNSTLESTYIAVRAFNSGHDMNNITIKNSTLKGKYCFWVHNYKAAGDSAGDDSTLNLDIFNGTNTFEYTGKAPVLYGFDTPIYFDENGAGVEVMEFAGVKAVPFFCNGVKAVSVAETTLNGKTWQDAMDWAEALGEGWVLASMEHLNAIYDNRVALNDVLEADSAENALFWEGDELYVKNGSVYYANYMSSTEVPEGGADANGNTYFPNRVFFKQFNARGYSDVLYSTFDSIHKYAPLKDFHYARGVYEF